MDRSEPSGVVLDVRDLSKAYETASGEVVRALDQVSFEVAAGELVAVYGPSGSGKTTLLKLLARVLVPDGGVVRVRGTDIAGLRGAALDRYRREELGLVLQSAQLVAGLNVAGNAALRLMEGRLRWREAQQRVVPLLERLDLGGELERMPSELSVGERQRVAIASALAPEPAGLVCDEPVSALDVSVRAQVLHLLLGLRRARGLALLLITHDIGLAWALCDRVAVMYLGRIVEIGAASDVLERPQHPYTEALIAVAPSTRPRPAGRAAILAGDVPDASRIPGGCRFHPRCPRARERCAAEDVALRPSGAAGQTAACWYPGPEG